MIKIGYLFDSCVYIKKINTASKIIDASKLSLKKFKKNYISDVVLSELDTKKSDMHTVVSNCIGLKAIELISINSEDNIVRNFRNIRKRYYYWMFDPLYLEKLIKNGMLTEEERKSYNFKYKDYGECSLIAIALTDEKKYKIVTEDKGRVYKHPNINIFGEHPNVNVMGFEEWKQKIEN